MSRLNKPKPRVPGLWQLIAIVVTALSLAAVVEDPPVATAPQPRSHRR